MFSVCDKECVLYKKFIRIIIPCDSEILDKHVCGKQDAQNSDFQSPTEK